MTQNTPNAIQSMGLASGTALIAVNFTHPIETVKTRMQVGNFNIKHMIKNEGVGSFWKGIQAAWLREASYTSVKLGGYLPIRNAINQISPGNESSFVLKFCAGSMSGSLGSIIGNPFDVMKTKMMANTDKKKPLNWDKRFKPIIWGQKKTH